MQRLEASDSGWIFWLGWLTWLAGLAINKPSEAPRLAVSCEELYAAPKSNPVNYRCWARLARRLAVLAGLARLARTGWLTCWLRCCPAGCLLGGPGRLGWPG